MSVRRSAAALALIALALVACGPTRRPEYVRWMASGDRAFSAGRMHEAAQAYDRAARDAIRLNDRDEAIYLAGQSYRRAGDIDAALARFDWLAQHGIALGRAPRGALEAARIRLARGERERAERDLLDLSRRFPTTGPARRAIDLVLLIRDDADPSGASSLAWIDAVYPILASTELGPALLYERARRLERMGRTDEAVRTFEQLLETPFPANTRWDDGGLAYARLLVALGRAVEALRVIDRVLAARETSVVQPGSYNRPHFQDLQLLRARLLRDELHDRAAAADAFHVLYADYPTSVYRDDALFEEAELRESMGQRPRACEIYTRLAREFPCTRRGRWGRERAAECGMPQPTPSPDAGCSERHSHRGEDGT